MSPTFLFFQKIAVPSGFSLLEMITVLVILGMLILGSFSFINKTAVNLYTERDMLVSRLLYARGQSMARNAGVCLKLQKGGSRIVPLLTLEEATGGGIASSLLAYPGEAALHTMPEDLTITADLESFCFDAQGRVCPQENLRVARSTPLCTHQDIPGTYFTITLSINLSSQSLILFHETGLLR